MRIYIKDPELRKALGRDACKELRDQLSNLSTQMGGMVKSFQIKAVKTKKNEVSVSLTLNAAVSEEEASFASGIDIVIK